MVREDLPPGRDSLYLTIYHAGRCGFTRSGFICSVSEERDPTQMGQLPYGADEGKQLELTSHAPSFSLREVALRN